MNKKFYLKTSDEAFEAVKSQKKGLSLEEAEKRLNENGKNILAEEKKDSLFKKFLLQFKDLMIIILLVAAAVSGALGEIADTIIILAIVILNAVIGVVQEAKAEKSLEALKKMALPHTTVRRDGKVQTIEIENLVVGDVVILNTGDYVPADMRLISSQNLKIEEAALTGESVPADKHDAVITEDNIVINDMKNMAFTGSYIVYGRGEGLVVSTGMNTEMGKIAKLLMAQDTTLTPLQKSIQTTGKYITIGVILIAAMTFLAGTIQGRDPLDMFLVAISLAVAAIPEGLPAIITIVLALGVQRMSEKHAIIKKLSAVETLGCTQIICTDKTGTLTQNKMTVMKLYSEGEIKELEALKTLTHTNSTFSKMAAYMVLCNDSTLSIEGGVPKVLGEPTENALVYFGFNMDQDKSVLENEHRRVFELAFDSARKMMSVVNQFDHELISITKGAPDVLLEKCTTIEKNGEILPLEKSDLEEILKANKTMADEALRVLALAYKNNGETYDEANLESEMTFLGLIAMIDPPREEVKDSIAQCKKAGIRTIMITGDHKDTAFAIAEKIGITDNREQVITGNELNLMSDEEIEANVEKYNVYARVSPEHKLKIIKAWKKKDKIVAMTGDGVNDAPALKVADIGVGMGITGTEVTKSVSNMVLTDDNFTSIVKAVEEGRHIYNNIRKTIQFLMSCNIGEVLLIFVSTMLGLTALVPVQILWVNLVTDSLPALALGVDKSNISVMDKPPRKSGDSIFSNGVGFAIIYQGILKGLIGLGLFLFAHEQYGTEVAMTMTFLVLGYIQLAHAFNVRSNTVSVFKMSIKENKALIVAVIIAFVLQSMPMVIPPLMDVFNVTALNITQWVLVIATSLSIILAIELVKIFVRLYTNKKSLT